MQQDVNLYLDFAKLLRGRIDELKGSEHQISQVDLANAAGIDPSTFSRLLNGKSQAHFARLTASQVEVLLTELRLTDKAAGIIVKYNLPVPVRFAGDVAQALGTLPASEPLDNVEWLEFKVYESASAGSGEGGPSGDEVIYLPRNILTAAGANPEDVMLVKINGDCMVSHEVHFGAKSIAHGDTVFAELGRPPIEGKPSLFWDAHDHQLIVKYLKEGDAGRPVVLYDARGKMYHRPADDPGLVYRGVVLGRYGLL